VASLVSAGDHVVVLGSVLDADARLGDPLTYHSRAFGTHRPLEAAS
jgi:flavin reductase (DIM6/NTAB) family NADH-FMN oxidoreductase RutF